MKVTIEQNGQKEEFDADVVAVSAQIGDSTRIVVAGEGKAVQYACLCEGLLDAREEIFSKHPSVKAIVEIKNILESIKSEEEEGNHDES